MAGIHTVPLLLALLGALSPLASLPAEGTGLIRRSMQDSSASWKLLWADEFDGSRLNRNKWDVQIAGGCQHGIPGWGNGERQWYTDLPQNLRVENSNLVIQAVNDPNNLVSPGQPYSSARIRTYGKFAMGPSATYPTVKVEARIKVPAGLGLWPAFWMLPTTNANGLCSGCGRHGHWAASGEIDIMEIRNDAMQVLGTIHYGGPWPLNTYATSGYTLPDGASFANDFHIYGIEWSAKQIRWYMDGQLYFVQNSGEGTNKGWFSLGPSATSPEYPALPGDGPFGTQRFHILLNLALGGETTEFTKVNNLGITQEQLDATLSNPKQMLVDWVRVWGR